MAKETKPEATAEAKPQILGVLPGIPMPEVHSKRGSTSKFPFDALTEVGMSFGIKGRDAKSMSSIVSSQNRKHAVEAKDANGNVIFKTKTLKGTDGTKTEVPTDKPKLEFTKQFVALDVDPKTDPEGASVRVWRKA